MGMIVHKYGGTSVGSVERIQQVAKRVAHTVDQGHRVVVVVSAMGKETDRLVSLIHELAPDQPTTVSHRREVDMALSTGEQVSIALLAIALQQLGYSAISMTGAQAGIHTTKDHTQARILDIDTDRIQRHLDQGEIVIVAGFQGITHSSDLDITTLGRGGSDTTAVALAVALQAEICEIYTDVPGVFTTDPRKVANAQLLEEITSDEMLELASLGAHVLHPRSVEIARNFGLKLKVLSSLVNWQDPQSGTMILSPIATSPDLADLNLIDRKRRMDRNGRIEMNKAVNQVTLDKNQVKLALLHVPDRPGIAAQLFQSIANAGLNVDLILQSIHTTYGSETNDIAFTVPQAALDQAQAVAYRVAQDLNCPQVVVDPAIAKVTIGGAGMIGRPGVAATMFEVLAQAGINLQMISMSEIKVSCVIDQDRASDAALLLGEYFQVIPHTHRPTHEPIWKPHPVSGVALDQHQARLALLHVPDQPGSAAHVFQRLANSGIVVDTIIQSQREQLNRKGMSTQNIAFTVPQFQAAAATQVLQSITTDMPEAEVMVNEAIAKVSIVGSQMEYHPGVAARMFQALAQSNINIEMIATSDIKVSCVVQQDQGVASLQCIHEIFHLHEPLAR